ncbi:hypothetical protein SAMN05880592_12637, partial [Bosea sp. TND4EK4]
LKDRRNAAMGMGRKPAPNRGCIATRGYRITLTEQQQGVGLAVRKYTMMKRGILASDAQRKPGSAISAAAKAEVDYLLARVAKTDPRAKV